MERRDFLKKVLVAPSAVGAFPAIHFFSDGSGDDLFEILRSLPGRSEIRFAIGNTDFDQLKSDLTQSNSWWRNLLKVKSGQSELELVSASLSDSSVASLHFNHEVPSEAFTHFLSSYFEKRSQSPVAVAQLVTGAEFSRQKDSLRIHVEEGRLDHLVLAHAKRRHLLENGFAQVEVAMMPSPDFWNVWNRGESAIVDFKPLSSVDDLKEMLESQASTWGLPKEQPFISFEEFKS